MPAYQNKKTKLWKFRTYAEDVYGNRKQYEKGGFETKKAALLAEREFQEIDKYEKTNITFEKLWQDYDNHMKLKLKTQSYRSVKNRIEKHILPYFKDYKITKITPGVYTKWQIEIESKGFSHKYNSTLHGAVRTMLNFAKKFYGLKENVASLVGNFTRKQELVKNIDFWTFEEFQRFIKEVDNTVYQIFFETLYYTGLRLGECLALNWNDFDGKSLDINKTLTRDIKEDKHVINTPKTVKSIRRVKLDDDLIKRLELLKQINSRIVGFNNNWFIFGNINPLAPTTVTRKKDKTCDLSGVKKIRIHDLRHSHASLLLSYGVPIIVISERLGHSDVNMTLNTYSHMIPKDEDKAIDILNQIKNSK